MYSQNLAFCYYTVDLVEEMDRWTETKNMHKLCEEQ